MNTMKSAVTVIFLLFVTNLFCLDLELTQGINTQLPIGINSFGTSSEALDLSNIISHDLLLSGQFKLIPKPQSDVSTILISSWHRAGAESVLSGKVDKIGMDAYLVDVNLVDTVGSAQSFLSRSFKVSSRELRSLAHHISDEVYQKLTGERGIFSTKIAYVLVQRGTQATKYYLEIADMDGDNPQSLLVSSDPIMSLAWSPNGREIAYVSFEKKKAQIFKVDITTGRRRLLTDFTGINGAPAWSRDGRELAVVLSKGGNPKIYSVDLSNGNMKQLTFGEAIDTEPRYAPDGKSLLFTSGRSGSPQIYRLSLQSGSITRLTYDGNYNARAMYTPDQKYLVMLHREDGNFNIAVQDLINGQLLALTSSPSNESPSVSPNGRMVLYASHYQGHSVLSLISIDAKAGIHLPSRVGDVQDPAWSPYLG